MEFQGGRPNQPKGLRHRTFEKHPEPHESPKELGATKHVLLQGWLPGGWPASSRFIPHPPTCPGRDGDRGRLDQVELKQTMMLTSECSSR